MFEKHPYKVIEVIGCSENSWEDATQSVIATASQSLRDLRIAEVVEQDAKIENGKVALFRVKLKLSFRLHESNA